MPAIDFRPIPLDAIPAGIISDLGPFLWETYLCPRDIVLLTSLWKTGKTTLLAGLLRAMGRGESFLGLRTAPGKIWVVSEESTEHWAERVRLIPIGSHVQLLSRPFAGRPTAEEWSSLIDAAVLERSSHSLDLVVIDPLASFLPGRCESDAATLLEALQPLRRLTDVGIAVLLLHHPRKNQAQAGSLARGSGALLGFVDLSIELIRSSHQNADRNTRTLRTQSRRPNITETLAYEWNPETGLFSTVQNRADRLFDENWTRIANLLTDRDPGITINELRTLWPDEEAKPSLSRMYEWMNTAFAAKRCRRNGQGSKLSPWTYRLPNDDDAYYDRGELPPLKELW